MAKSPGPVTLQDVADAAGVSLSTASRALNGEASGRRVTEALRDRVFEASRRLNFVPNPNAQATARGRSHAIGVVVGDISEPYYATIAAGLLDAVDDAGGTHMVTVANTHYDAEVERRHVTRLRVQRAAVIVLVGSTGNDNDDTLGAEVQEFVASGGRAVAIGPPTLGIDTVSPADDEGADDLARYLVDLGYTDFGVLAGPESWATATTRSQAFQAAVAAAGHPCRPGTVVHCDFNRDGGYQAALDLLERGRPPRCLFAVSDMIAVGAMAALRENGVDVPDEVAVAGFGDVATARDVYPALTTVRLPLRRMGAMAVEVTTRSEPSTTPRRILVRGEVVARASTPPLKP